jgi:NADH-quinone oxidoreductase subunit N
MSILFGLTGTLDLAAINSSLANYNGNLLPLVTAILMIFGGIAYKISAVPFHYWTPDVYEGSTIATTALLSVASKAAGFAVLIRFLKAGFIDANASPSDDIWVTLSSFDWSYLIAIIAVLTMTVGNLLAIWQENVKRMLAYSSIAHAGYMLMGLMVMNTAGIEAVLFYFITYLLMNFGAFYVVQLVANETGGEDMNDYAGLAYKNPMVALAMTIFLISLTGMPPFAGFLAKLYLFTPVIEAGYVGIAVIGVLNSVVSVFYYVKLVRNMYLRGDVETTERVVVGKGSIVFLYMMAIPVLFLIVNFKPVLEWIKYSAIMIIK